MGSCFWGGKVGWRGVTKENIPGGSSTEEQQSQPAFTAKTLRASALLSSASVGSILTAHCGDARTSPPWHTSKSLSAGPLAISRQALRFYDQQFEHFSLRVPPSSAPSGKSAVNSLFPKGLTGRLFTADDADFTDGNKTARSGFIRHLSSLWPG